MSLSMIQLWQIVFSGWINPMVSSSLFPKTKRNLQSCGGKEKGTARSWRTRKWPEHWGTMEEQVKSLKSEESWHISSVQLFYKDSLPLISWEKRQFIVSTFSLIKNTSVRMTGSLTIITCITTTMHCSMLTARFTSHINLSFIAKNILGELTLLYIFPSKNITHILKNIQNWSCFSPIIITFLLGLQLK